MNVQPNRLGQLNLSPEVARLHNNFQKNLYDAELPVSNLSFDIQDIKTNKKEKNPADKLTELGFVTGLTATALQLISGAAFVGTSILGDKVKKEGAAAFKKGPILTKLAHVSLGLSFIIGTPSVAGAGVNSKQPGLVVNALATGAVGLLMMKSFGTRTKGLLSLTFAPMLAGFSNKISNDFNIKEHENPREMDLDFILDKDTYINPDGSGIDIKKIGSSYKELGSFLFYDQINALKTTSKTVKKTIVECKDYVLGKTEEKPAIFSVKPSKESMSLASILMIAGSLPKIFAGEALGGKKLKISEFLIGSAFLFESLGMMSAANARDDSRRLPVLLGGPLRIIGDFRQENNLMYGIRTLGAASFEYYYALMNKEENGEIKKK